VLCAGCSGGDQNTVFTWLAEFGGLETEQDYPFKNVDDFCRYNPKRV
jgi:hypothetical protein